jgi:hypothetical protein
MYLNSSGQKYTFVSTLTAGTVANTERCAMALNKAENLLAISHVKSSRVYVEFFDVTYDDDTYLPSIAVSSITEIPHTDIKSTQYNATNADALAFDVADNLYVACASTEILRAFALPKADNSFTTPAPSASTIEVSVASGIGSQVAGKAVKSVQYFDLTGKPATGATKGFVIKKTIYEDGSIKNSKAVK